MTGFSYPPAREGICIYVVGDIHGRADLLERLHHRIDADRDERLLNVEIYLGDYIDRGDRSKDVIDALLERNRRYPGRVVFLRGNHEQMLLDFIGGASIDLMANGGASTFAAYGIDHTQAPATLRRKLRDRLPPAHLDFISGTRLYFDGGDYVFVHAGIRPGIALEDQDPDDLLWIRDEFLSTSLNTRFVVVHGHTPVDQPEFYPWRINIDTGAYITNRLTCLRISDRGPELLY